MATIFPEDDEEFQNDFFNDTNFTRSLLVSAASNVATDLGLDYESLFPTEEVGSTYRIAGDITIFNSTAASATWYTGTNDAFAKKFIDLFNEELTKVGSSIRFEERDNPYAYEGESSFDLRIGSFLLVTQMLGGHITTEKSTNMYYYTTRSGLLPSAFWIFQYLFWMALSTVSIGLTALSGLILDIDVQIGAYFVAAWFHIAFAVLLGSIFKDKKYVNLSTFFLLIIGFVIPIVFLSIEDSERHRNIHDVFKVIPVFFFMGDVTTSQLQYGLIVSACCTVLAAYIAPLLTVSDGMYAGSKVNFFYFLSMKFWKEGIVALPAYEESLPRSENFEEEESAYVSTESLTYHNCVKKFGEEKVIGPMNLALKTGNITTLLGPNGVGKSTLMRVAAGYYIPSAGEMILQGTNAFRESPWSCLKSISFCPQDNYLYDSMTVEEHMLFMASLRDMSRIDDEDIASHITWVLTTLDIVNKKDTLAKNLSGGMKRRLCLAMSTVGFPKVILCDEPSSGVDSVSQRGIWKLLETAKKKSAILLTSHSSLEAVILSDSVVLMKSSEDIIQTSGTDNLAFSLKNTEKNTVHEYDINGNDMKEVANIIETLPNDGSEWKIVSKQLTDEEPSPLQDVLEDMKKDDTSDAEDGSHASDTIPETLNSGTPGTWHQIGVLISIGLFLHIDRLFFFVFFLLPLNGAQIWFAHEMPSWNDMAHLIIMPLTPMIAFIASGIIIVQVVAIVSQERDLGITKLLFSTGVSRFAYLISYVLLYSLLSFPFSVGMLVAVGSIYGTASGMVAIFWMTFSYFILIMGISVGLGATLDQRTGLICTLILPSVFAIFGQGTTSQMFADAYPGAMGQVIASLFIDNMSRNDWALYAVCFIVNILLGSVGFYIYVVRVGDYHPLSNLFQKKKTTDEINEDETDIESHAIEDPNIFLEGKTITKVYGVGEKNKSSFKALDDVTFAVTKGSLLGLVGKSGAGKSTLMDVLSGQINTTEGVVFVEGKRVPPSEISSVVSMCGQLDTVWPDINVGKAIKIFMRCRGYKTSAYGDKISDPYVEHIVNELGIDEMLSKKVKTLSGGQKRRLAFLVSLLGDTKVVLVDEAMTGVDSETRKVMWKILQNEVRLRDRSVVVTSHEMTEIEQYCNTVGILHNGKLVEMGLLNDIKKKWSDSIKLICLFSSSSSISNVEENIQNIQSSVVVQSHHVDVLVEDNDDSRIVVTYAINLIDLKNIASLIQTMNKAKDGDDSLLYWSIGPQSLDDFVRSKSKNAII